MLFSKHTNKYYLKYSPMLLLGIIALIVVDYFQLKIPEIYKMIINGINNGFVETDKGNLPFDVDFLLYEVCRPMLVIIVAMVVCRFLWRLSFFGTAIKVETSLRSRMFKRSKELSEEYYQVNKVGNLMSLYTNDLETVHECFGDGILMLFDAVLLGALAIFKMAGMDRLLTLLSLIPMALLLTAATIVGKYMMRKWKVRQEAFSAISDFSQESFSGISVIKAFVKEAHELISFKRLNKENEKANVDYTKYSTLLKIFVTLFVESVVCIILGYGGYLVYIDRFDAGQLVEFVSYFTTIVWPVMAVSQLIELTSRGKASIERISELLEAEISVKDSESVCDIPEIFGDIEARGLTFSYPGASYPALDNISFSIKRGENVGIVGATGSGKTTLVDLILRTYNVPPKMLFIDGVDVNEIPIKTVRKFSAYVPQDNFLFSDTIENNIAFSRDNYDMSDVIRAARLSDVDENVSEFSEGYSTVLGERGVTVSGGQKQRISIARALMKDAAILILDDSVSAVDTRTEKVILNNLREERRGKTTILIAHRISTLVGMDKIIFISDGRLVGVGTHEELLSDCPPYAKMVELQRLEDSEKGGNSK